MKKVLTALIALTLFSCHSNPGYAASVTVDNSRIYVKEHGVTKDYGTVRKVKETNGKVEVYTNKNYNKPAVSFDRNGSVTTQEFPGSKKTTYSRWNNEVEEDEDDE